MSNIFFSSDLHFDHKNIIKYSHRPYADVDEMNEALITNHNSVVKPGDTWYHLGDFCFGGSDRIPKHLKRMNGQKIFLKGNHDRSHNFKDLVGDFRNDWFGKIGKYSYHLYHYPIQSWNGAFHGSVHLHGHSHGSTPSPGMLRWDMGVDCWNWFPVSLEELEQVINKRKEELKGKDLDPGRAGHHA